MVIVSNQEDMGAMNIILFNIVVVLKPHSLSECVANSVASFAQVGICQVSVAHGGLDGFMAEAFAYYLKRNVFH